MGSAYAVKWSAMSKIDPNKPIRYKVVVRGGGKPQKTYRNQTHQEADNISVQAKLDGRNAVITMEKQK